MGGEIETESRDRLARSMRIQSWAGKTWRRARKMARFVGPGAMVSVSYIDPGNYSTGISAGASFRFDLLSVILISNILAIFLQSLCLRLGTVTGRDLARVSRDHLPRWLNWILYFFAEGAIIATDLAEVIGVAIAINILSQGTIPLLAGVAITMIDVIIILIFYSRSGRSMLKTQLFEVAVAILVIAVAICFSIELSKITGINAGEVFKGYIPNKTMVTSEGLYNSCGILGATVMPHSLYLGSGLVQSRLKDYDMRKGNWSPASVENSTSSQAQLTETERDLIEEKYRPSLAAIRDSLPYSQAELVFALLTFALFINSAIIIVSGATLYNTPGADSADLFSIYDLLSAQLGKAAGTIFALALLLSGQSAGLVVTLAGQMVSEGYIRWTITPWKRRLATRLIAVIPCIIVAGAVGKEGLDDVLNASQVALSIILPFVTAPLIYFTSKKEIMSVPDPTAEILAPSSSADEQGVPSVPMKDLSNGWFIATIGWAIWLFITALNVYLIVQLGLGNT